MVGYLNKVQLIGRVGRDPEIRSVGSGAKVANFSVATTESWKDKRSGEWVDKTEWHNIVVWNEATVGWLEKNIFKGMMVFVEGKLETREYQDKDGNTRKSTEIVLKPFNGQVLSLEGKKDGDGGGRGRSDDDDGGRGSRGGRDDRSSAGRPRDDERGSRSNGGGGGARRPAREEIDDDIPF